MTHRLRFSTESSGRSSIEMAQRHPGCASPAVTVFIENGDRQVTKRYAVTGEENLDAVIERIGKQIRDVLQPKVKTLVHSTPTDMPLSQYSAAGVLQVSEPEDEEELDQFSASSYGGSQYKSSLDIQSSVEKVTSAFESTPPVPLVPRPEIFRGTGFVLSASVEELDLMSKVRFEEVIRAGGGIVYDEIPKSETQDLVLVSGAASRTKKYLEALTLGIPTISRTWIEDAVTNGHSAEECKIQNIARHYYLPRGVDPITEKEVPAVEGLTLCRPFEHHVVYLQGRSHFKKQWSGLVKSGCGTAITRYVSGSPKPTVVASDGEMRPSKTSEEFGVPIVTQDWLYSCVIHGQPVEMEPYKLVWV